MKRINLLVVVFLTLLACSTAEEKENEIIPIDEVPDDIIASKPCGTLYGSIMGMFREHEVNNLVHPVLFTDTIEKRIVITRESEVYVSFISEGAGWANSLGWYTYDAAGEVPSRDNLDLQILFPHVADNVLKQGDMLQVGSGKFKPGTVIGFFLVVRGWENGSVNLGKTINFTDNSLNQNQLQQHILFKEGDCGDVVLAFEDKTPEQGSDMDYNDIIFTLSDNNQQLQTVSFDFSHIVVL